MEGIIKTKIVVVGGTILVKKPGSSLLISFGDECFLPFFCAPMSAVLQAPVALATSTSSKGGSDLQLVPLPLAWYRNQLFFRPKMWVEINEFLHIFESELIAKFRGFFFSCSQGKRELNRRFLCRVVLNFYVLL